MSVGSGSVKRVAAKTAVVEDNKVVEKKNDSKEKKTTAKVATKTATKTTTKTAAKTAASKSTKKGGSVDSKSKAVQKTTEVVNKNNKENAVKTVEVCHITEQLPIHLL